MKSYIKKGSILPGPAVRCSSNQGSILLSIIWMLTMLVIFTIVIGRQASQELMFGQSLKVRTLTRLIVRSGVERISYELQEDPIEAYDALNEPWASNEKGLKDISVGDGAFSIRCSAEPDDSEQILYGACDESARLNLNTAREHYLKNLYLAVQDKTDEESDKFATQFAQSVIDWRDTDDSVQASGAEAADYKDLPEPYKPRNAPFESVEELLMVKGVTQNLFDKMKPYVTVYSAGPVNFNTAPIPVLQALGLNKPLAQHVAEFRKGADRRAGTEDDEIFSEPAGITPALSAAGSFSSEDFAQIANALSEGMVSVKSSVFRIYVYSRLNTDSRGLETQATCVMSRKGSILYWREGA